ncbi:MAG: 4-hydroxy-3-methylbut-2-enyl diphosphate reductase [Alphaproteobacteria bacterium]
MTSHAINAKPPLTILLAAPRGFCAGVERAVQMVEESLRLYGSPVYVRHQIVHNQAVVNRLSSMGAVFVENLAGLPAGAKVIFSAHGVAKSVPLDAKERGLIPLDATCPLVTKVHREAEKHFAEGRQIILVGHRGHPEVTGTMGQLPEGAVLLVENEADARSVQPTTPQHLAYCTQTTLSVDDTIKIVGILQQRFPTIEGPKREDICYATTNRQKAVKAIAEMADAVLVLGSANSSNSNRLVEVALSTGCPQARLIDGADNLDMGWLQTVKRLGITAGASAPEHLVEELLEKIRLHYSVTVEEIRVAEENVVFRMPRLPQPEQAH